MADGGRYQRCEKNESEDGGRRTHWFEDKAGLCLELGGRRDGVAAADSVDDLPMSPKVITRDIVATLENSRHLGLKLAAHAWFLGLFQAEFKAFVGDGSSWIWTIFDKHFRAFKFIAVLDIIHAVTYAFAAAMAGRTEAEGTVIYHQWVSWLWSGEVSQRSLAGDCGFGETTVRTGASHC